MGQLAAIKAPDYVVVGHITQDITPQGLTPGGTALYSGLTAHALGFSVGIHTSFSDTLNLQLPPGAQISIIPSAETSTFKNVQKNNGRTQYIYQRAQPIPTETIPTAWRNARILHLGPVAREIDVGTLKTFSHALIGVTPQGWMRQWDSEGKIHFEYQDCIDEILCKADIAIISLEDIQFNEDIIESMAAEIGILVITEGEKGARVYWNGDQRHFRPPVVSEVNSTGAGDIFAAAFFFRYYHTRNPWEAARFANLLAAGSVTRKGLNSIPSEDEIRANLVEVLRET